MTSSRERRKGSSKISSRVNKKSVSKRIGEDSSESSDNEASRDLPAEESENDCPVYNDEDFTVEGGDEDCALVVVGDPVGGGDNDDNDDNEGGLGAVNSNMLKRSAIAFLFEERLRLNPKLTRYDMADEIKREYNLEVTPDQCGKAKTKVLSARKASHESHFGRIWDYQAEIFKQNKDSQFEIETVPGPVIGSKQRYAIVA